MTDTYTGVNTEISQQIENAYKVEDTIQRMDASGIWNGAKDWVSPAFDVPQDQAETTLVNAVVDLRDRIGKYIQDEKSAGRLQKEDIADAEFFMLHNIGSEFVPTIQEHADKDDNLAEIGIAGILNEVFDKQVDQKKSFDEAQVAAITADAIKVNEPPEVSNYEKFKMKVEAGYQVAKEKVTGYAKHLKETFSDPKTQIDFLVGSVRVVGAIAGAGIAGGAMAGEAYAQGLDNNDDDQQGETGYHDTGLVQQRPDISSEGTSHVYQMAHEAIYGPESDLGQIPSSDIAHINTMGHLQADETTDFSVEDIVNHLEARDQEPNEKDIFSQVIKGEFEAHDNRWSKEFNLGFNSNDEVKSHTFTPDKLIETDANDVFSRGADGRDRAALDLDQVNNFDEALRTLFEKYNGSHPDTQVDIDSAIAELKADWGIKNETEDGFQTNGVYQDADGNIHAKEITFDKDVEIAGNGITDQKLEEQDSDTGAWVPIVIENGKVVGGEMFVGGSTADQINPEADEVWQDDQSLIAAYTDGVRSLDMEWLVPDQSEVQADTEHEKLTVEQVIQIIEENFPSDEPIELTPEIIEDIPEEVIKIIEIIIPEEPPDETTELTEDEPPAVEITDEQVKVIAEWYKNNRGKGNQLVFGYDVNNPSNLRGGIFGHLSHEQKMAFLRYADIEEVHPSESIGAVNPNLTSPDIEKAAAQQGSSIAAGGGNPHTPQGIMTGNQENQSEQEIAKNQGQEQKLEFDTEDQTDKDKAADAAAKAAEKAAEQAAKEAQKAAQDAAKKAEQDAKDAAKAAEQAAKEAQKAAEKAARDAEKAADAEAREAEKAAKEAEKTTGKPEETGNSKK